MGRYTMFTEIKNRTALWLSNPTSGCVFKGNENRILERYLPSGVHRSVSQGSHHTGNNGSVSQQMNG